MITLCNKYANTWTLENFILKGHLWHLLHFKFKVVWYCNLYINIIILRLNINSIVSSLFFNHSLPFLSQFHSKITSQCICLNRLCLWWHSVFTFFFKLKLSITFPLSRFPTAWASLFDSGVRDFTVKVPHGSRNCPPRKLDHQFFVHRVPWEPFAPPHLFSAIYLNVQFLQGGEKGA